MRWLAQMDAWAEQVRATTALGRRRFDADTNIQDSLKHRLGGVGQQAEHLYGTPAQRATGQRFIDADPDYGDLPWPWHAMAAVRKRIGHYGPVDLDVLWDSATNRLEQSLAVLRPLLDEATRYCKENGVVLVGVPATTSTKPSLPSLPSLVSVTGPGYDEPRCGQPIRSANGVPCRLQPGHGGSCRSR